MVGGKVDGQILFGARSEKPTILFGARLRNGKIYLVPNDSYEKYYLAVKGLNPLACTGNRLPSGDMIAFFDVVSRLFRLESLGADQKQLGDESSTEDDDCASSDNTQEETNDLDVSTSPSVSEDVSPCGTLLPSAAGGNLDVKASDGVLKGLFDGLLADMSLRERLDNEQFLQAHMVSF